MTTNEHHRQSLKSAADIQRDIELIRLAYRERNSPAHEHYNPLPMVLAWGGGVTLSLALLYAFIHAFIL